MGASCNRQSENLVKSPTIDSSDYLLGKNQSDLNKKTSYDFDVNRLNFIPDSDQLWEPPPSSPKYVPQPTTILERPRTLFNYPNSIKMPTQLKYKCDQCGMIFPTDESLFKHKTRFCIGVKDSGIGRKPVYSDEEDIDNDNNTTRTSRKKVIRHQSPVEKVRLISILFIYYAVGCFL